MQRACLRTQALVPTAFDMYAKVAFSASLTCTPPMPRNPPSEEASATFVSTALAGDAHPPLLKQAGALWINPVEHECEPREEREDEQAHK